MDNATDNTTASGDAAPTRRPPLIRSMWFWLFVAFVVLIGAWTALIVTAISHEPERIEIPPPTPATETRDATGD